MIFSLRERSVFKEKWYFAGDGERKYLELSRGAVGNLRVRGPALLGLQRRTGFRARPDERVEATAPAEPAWPAPRTQLVPPDEALLEQSREAAADREGELHAEAPVPALPLARPHQCQQQQQHHQPGRLRAPLGDVQAQHHPQVRRRPAPAHPPPFRGAGLTPAGVPCLAVRLKST